MRIFLDHSPYTENITGQNRGKAADPSYLGSPIQVPLAFQK